MEEKSVAGIGEQIEMMRLASSEIRDLRRVIADLTPKAEAWDALRQVLELLPRRGQGMSPDVAWMLDERIATLEGLIQAPAAEG